MNKSDEIKRIAGYGKLYLARFLKCDERDKKDIRTNWYRALLFFFGYSFARGRSGSLSDKFRFAALKALREFGPRLKPGFNKRELEKYLEHRGVTNPGDCRMVAETLKFALEDKELKRLGNNIVEFAITNIEDGNIRVAHKRLDKIFEIGDKLACFFLRDVVLLYGLKRHLDDGDFTYCQPVDTWVNQLAAKLRLVRQPKDGKRGLNKHELDQLKEAIFRQCRKARVSPLLFNTGLWMAGAQPFELVIEKLRRSGSRNQVDRKALVRELRYIEKLRTSGRSEVSDSEDRG